MFGQVGVEFTDELGISRIVRLFSLMLGRSLGRSFRALAGINIELRDWLDTVANFRVHGTTQRVVTEAFAADQP